MQLLNQELILCSTSLLYIYLVKLIDMKFSIADNEKETLLSSLKIANLKFQQVYPGDKPDRQPVHTVYGGANLFKSDTCIKMGNIALKNLQTYAPNFVVLADVLQ